MRVLLAGWFTFERGEATAGDLLAAETARDWLRSEGIPHDTALSGTFRGSGWEGVDYRRVPPEDYSDVFFVCGPASGRQVRELAERFAGCRLTGLGVSLIGPDTEPPRFDRLLERDGTEIRRPDLSFLAPREPVPLAGLVLSHEQPEYGEAANDAAVHDALLFALQEERASFLSFGTRVDPREPPGGVAFRSAAEVEAVFRGLDLVVTTRLHGLVHALRAGVPALAVDPITGGAKVSRQARAVGWPAVLVAGGSPNLLDAEKVKETFAYCLTGEAREQARGCAESAARELPGLRDEFLRSLGK